MHKNNQPHLKEFWSSALDLSNKNHMLRDIARNQFYDKILKETVTDKRCLDIGFGTGILSYLALKYNPKHITAYEMNGPRFEFASWLLKKLNLQNKITLINEKCHASIISQEYDLVYHELLGSELWNEFVMSQFNTTVPMVPAIYHSDFYITEVDQEYFDRTVNVKKNSNFKFWYDIVKDDQWPSITNYDQFYTLPQWIQDELINDFDFNNQNFENKLDSDIDFGVEFTCNYDKEMNKFFKSPMNAPAPIYPLHFSSSAPFVQEQRFYSPHKNKNSKKIASISVNQNNKTVTIENPIGSYQTCDINFSQAWANLCIDDIAIKNKIFVIQPVFSLKHNSHSLVMQDGCWGSSQQGRIVKNVKNLRISQNLEWGTIYYGQDI